MPLRLEIRLVGVLISTCFSSVPGDDLRFFLDTTGRRGERAFERTLVRTCGEDVVDELETLDLPADAEVVTFLSLFCFGRQIPSATGMGIHT